MARRGAPGGAAGSGEGMGLRRGDRAPEFTLPRAGGGAVSLSAYRGGWTVLVFLRYLG